jgi:hypothetical protein
MRVTVTSTIFALGWLLMGCSHDNSSEKPLSDSDISERIVGTWKVNETSPNGVSSSGTVSILRDGSVTCAAKYVRGERDLIMNYTASWQVENGFLIETIKTTGNSNLLAIGFVTRDKVLSLDDQKFVFQTESGGKIIRKRNK